VGRGSERGWGECMHLLVWCARGDSWGDRHRDRRAQTQTQTQQPQTQQPQTRNHEPADRQRDKKTRTETGTQKGKRTEAIKGTMNRDLGSVRVGLPLAFLRASVAPANRSACPDEGSLQRASGCVSLRLGFDGAHARMHTCTQTHGICARCCRAMPRGPGDEHAPALPMQHLHPRQTRL
jgi:hypothetical protein